MKQPQSWTRIPPYSRRFEPLRIKAGMMMGWGQCRYAGKIGCAEIRSAGRTAKRRRGGGTIFYAVEDASVLCGNGVYLHGCVFIGARYDWRRGWRDCHKETPAQIKIEHPSGLIDVVFDYSHVGGFSLHSAGLLRTARKLFSGDICIPANAWEDGC